MVRKRGPQYYVERNNTIYDEYVTTDMSYTDLSYKYDLTRSMILKIIKDIRKERGDKKVADTDDHFIAPAPKPPRPTRQALTQEESEQLRIYRNTINVNPYINFKTNKTHEPYKDNSGLSKNMNINAKIFDNNEFNYNSHKNNKPIEKFNNNSPFTISHQLTSAPSQTHPLPTQIQNTNKKPSKIGKPPRNIFDGMRDIN